MPIIGIILFIVGGATTHHYQYDSDGNAAPHLWFMVIAGIALIIIGFVTHFILWIIGIVNASQINGLTGNSTLLIVFAVFTFWFVHLIIAVTTRNQFRNGGISTQGLSTSTSAFEQKLKQSFINGVISSDEYEKN